MVKNAIAQFHHSILYLMQLSYQKNQTYKAECFQQLVLVFPWDSGEEILSVLHTVIDEPAKSAVLPCSNNSMSVPPCSPVRCYPASLQPHLLFKIYQNQFCFWCSLSAGQSRRLCVGTDHTICLVSLHQSHFPSPWEAWCAVPLQLAYLTQKCLFSA